MALLIYHVKRLGELAVAELNVESWNRLIRETITLQEHVEYYNSAIHPMGNKI